jgi:hypothetical protein
MSTHSQFLMHWTGRSGKDDIESKPNEERPDLYVERLIDYYSNGLFARRTDEAVVRGMKIKNIVRLCFTEIRLSQVRTHSDRYGKLGVGFTREFIMARGGRPVIYVPHSAKKGGRLLEESIRNVFERSKSDEETHRSAKWIMAHVKRMSDGGSPENQDYQDYYEEMEWRIVYDETPGNTHFAKGHQKGTHRLKFRATDVQVIIFPDPATRTKALGAEKMREYLVAHMPILATLDDCVHF